MKVVAVFFRYAYGSKARGDSLEYEGFIPALEKIADKVCPFWIDEYLTQKGELQTRLIDFVDKEKPDVVLFVLMKDEFSFETLDYLKEKYVTVNWFCDDQWRFDGFTRHYAPHFTWSITTDKFALEKYRKIGYSNVVFSQWASFSGVDENSLDNIDYKCDVSFVGKASGYREWIVKALKRQGIHVECFGYGWKNGVISFKEMKDIFKRSKININMSNSVSYDLRCVRSSLRSVKELFRSTKTFEQIKARAFEIPASGGFQLTNYVLTLEDYFDIGKEVAVYSSLEDLEIQIRHYLGNELARKSVLSDGYKRAISEHLYVHRLKNSFENMGLLK